MAAKLTAAQKRERKETSTKRLKELLKPGQTIYYIRRVLTRHGRRNLSLLVIDDNDLNDISARVSDVIEMRWDDNHGGIWTQGTAQDLAYHLSMALFGGNVGQFKVRQL